MLSDYFYSGTVKKAVAIFGTLFNNVSIRRVDGNGAVVQTTRVPLSYGPRSKFLERISAQKDLNDPKVAIKLPRLSFEITSISPETNIRLNPLNKVISSGSTYYQSQPYTIDFTLSVYGKTLDDVLQITEQILPFFAPEYTVSVKDMEYPGSRTDVPIVLTSVTPGDDYEGSLDSNRVIIYTLGFTMRVKFAKILTREPKRILRVDVNFFDKLKDEGLEPIESLSVIADSQNDTSFEIEYSP